MQVTKEFIINLQHIFLLQVSILDLGLSIGRAGCAALCQHSKDAERKMQSREWHLHRLSDQDVWAEVCSLPLRCRVGDEQASLTREDGEQWLEVGCRNNAGRNGRDKERLNFFRAWITSSKVPFNLSYSMLIRACLSLTWCTKWGCGRNSIKTCKKKKNEVKGRVIITPRREFQVQSRELPAERHFASVHVQDYNRVNSSRTEREEKTQ